MNKKFKLENLNHREAIALMTVIDGMVAHWVQNKAEGHSPCPELLKDVLRIHENMANSWPEITKLIYSVDKTDENTH